MGFQEVILLSAFAITFLSGRLLAQYITVDSRSLDCGLPKDGGGYLDENDILWMFDAPYITTGDTEVVYYKAGNHPLNTLRYFKGDRSKYCYFIPDLIQGKYYLVRPMFYYKNYDGLNKNTISFSFIIDTQEWNIMFTEALTRSVWEEYMVPAKSSSMSICLAKGRTGNFTPFISSLEIRPLPDTLPSVMVLNNQYASKRIMCVDFGVSKGELIRYPKDSLDQFWETIPGMLPPLTTVDQVMSRESLVPSKFLQTTIDLISLTFTVERLANYTIDFYFAEISPIVLEEGYHVFDIYLGTNTRPLDFDIDIFKAVGMNNGYTIEKLHAPIMLSGINEFFFKKKSTSLFGPIFIKT